MTLILAIDPGPVISGWVLYETETRSVFECGGEEPNEALRKRIANSPASVLAIEWPEVFGQTGTFQSILETCFQAGQMVQAWPGDYIRVTRREVKLHMLGRSNGTDAQVRAVLRDLLGEKGTKAAPGPLHGVAKHAWEALAVAVTAADTKWEG